MPVRRDSLCMLGQVRHPPFRLELPCVVAPQLLRAIHDLQRNDNGLALRYYDVIRDFAVGQHDGHGERDHVLTPSLVNAQFSSATS
jgi:hypothetical protein